MSSKTVNASSKTERDTLAKVRAHIAAIETRLKKADSANKRSVTALRKAFNALADQSGDANQEALNRRLDQLEAQLNAQLKQTRADVAAQLKSALSGAQGPDGQISGLLTASRTASQRITQGEIRQAEAIQKINEQIARLASALDARLQTETRERLASESLLKQRLDSLEALTEQRIMSVEDQSAEAITGIGERLTMLSAELANRDQSNDLRTQGLIQERIYEVALDQQKELEVHRANIDHMLAQKEAQQETILAPLQRSIATLSARLESLEYGMQTVVTPAAAAAIPPFPEAPAARVEPETPADITDSTQLEELAAPLTADAFTPAEQTVLPETIQAATPSPYQDPSASPTQSGSNPYANLAKGEFAEFDPAAFYAEPSPAITPPPFDASQHASSEAPAPMMNAQPFTPMAPSPLDSSDLGSPANPYAADPNGYQFSAEEFYGDAQSEFDASPVNDPLYSANDLGVDQSMNAARPGAPQTAGKMKGSFGLSKRTLRTAASAAALVAVVTAGALVAKNKLLDSADEPKTVRAQNNAQTPARAPNDAAQVATANPALTSPAYDVTLSQPTGTFGDGTRLEDSNPKVAEFKTLEAALEAGDPIAQLQYGQVLMTQGKPKEAAEYFRKSASQGQPAAQYYLGDLYSSGEGVTADITQARKLTQMAAQAGHRFAMYDLGLYYANDAQQGGPQAEQSIRLAASWFRKAADFGMADAQFNLASLHSAPSSSLSNPLEAYVWFSIAAKQGDQEAAEQADMIRNLLPGDALGRAEARIAGFSPASIDKSANGIFTDLAWNKQKPRSNPDIAKVQSLLTGLGFEAGVADGAMGPKTREAIRAFERSNGLTETGQVNPELIQRLEATSGA